MTPNVPSDLDRIAPLVVSYYQWLADQGGASPEDLLSPDLTPTQRRLLLAYMDDVLVVFGETAPMRTVQSANDQIPTD